MSQMVTCNCKDFSTTALARGSEGLCITNPSVEPGSDLLKAIAWVSEPGVSPGPMTCSHSTRLRCLPKGVPVSDIGLADRLGEAVPQTRPAFQPDPDSWSQGALLVLGTCVIRTVCARKSARLVPG
ncbi:hypothetical protein KIL84_009994 [Mauremys mutica]|uniref:Uncharacterized protein n=1 Tax=Mauremys mutica TaxID=74926 RepID=A0A9D3XNC8_9SAUR|nr:hypothetical protein KIL84_009994 [Mauremys mutica]